MATQAPLSAVGQYSTVYRGEGRGRPVGVELQSMRIAGQEVVRSQRVRWQYNRSIYRGEQYIRPSTTNLRTLAPSYRLPSGRRRDSVNRARRFVDGRASTLTMNKPNFGVKPEANTRQAFDAAEIATKIVNYYWTREDLATKFRHMIRMGDIDGIAFMSVYYDHTKGDPISLPFSKDGRPIADPGVLIALEAEGLVEWREDHMGDVCVRNVPVGRLSIDPLARDRFDEARWIIESRVRPRAEIEQEAGRSLDSFIRQSGANMGDRYGAGTYNITPNQNSRVTVDEFDDSGQVLDGRDYLIVHEGFIKPTGKFGDWPDGCHAVWLDIAPGEPIYVGPWKYSLPYVCYVPQPDHGHFLKSRAVMDDLAPVQIALNRAVSQYHEILDLHARLPMLAQRGALVSKFLYNEKRIVEYNPGFQQPNWMQAPPEPTRLLENINFLLEQMAEIAVQNDVSRGTPPGGGIEAGVSLNLLAQQNEQQLESISSAAKRAMEETCSKMLEVICNFFNVQRTIAIPGVNGVEEINNFMGSQLRGCTRVQVTGSILPRNSAAQQQTLITLATGGLIDIRPYLPQLTEGRVEEITTDMERHEREQRRENAEMDLLGSLPNIDKLWAAFQEMRKEHAAMMDEYNSAQAMFDQAPDPGAPPEMGMPQDPNQMTVPGLPESFGPPPTPALPPPPAPPKLADLGIEIPIPQEWNDDALHSAELDRARCSDGYIDRHPLVRQAYHEHNEMHVARMSERLDALRVQPGGPQGPPDSVESPQPGGAAPDQGAGGQPPSANAPAGPASAMSPAGAGAPSDMGGSMPAFNFAPGSITINSTPAAEPPEPPEAPVVNVAPAQVNVPDINIPAPVVHVAPSEAPHVTVEAAKAPDVHVDAPVVNIDNRRGPVRIKVERDSRGLISAMTLEEDGG